MSPFSIVFNGNTNPKTETFHSVFIRKRSNGNEVLVVCNLAVAANIGLAFGRMVDHYCIEYQVGQKGLCSC